MTDEERDLMQRLAKSLFKTAEAMFSDGMGHKDGAFRLCARELSVATRMAKGVAVSKEERETLFDGAIKAIELAEKAGLSLAQREKMMIRPSDIPLMRKLWREGPSSDEPLPKPTVPPPSMRLQ